jgi:hypothetical protein
MEDYMGHWQRDDMELGEGKIIDGASSQDVDHKSANSFTSASKRTVDRVKRYRRIAF